MPIYTPAISPTPSKSINQRHKTTKVGETPDELDSFLPYSIAELRQYPDAQKPRKEPIYVRVFNIALINLGGGTGKKLSQPWLESNPLLGINHPPEDIKRATL